eukprot:c18104_g1_i1.p1 GENE.c18104_g1_i1~~c18104_g1_i1.p1  ORF type:complete len:541 (-),score=97.13 c18104_g1_i1:5-1543(-)
MRRKRSTLSEASVRLQSQNQHKDARAKIVTRFNIVYIVNLVLNIAFALFRLKTWVGRSGSKTRQCYQEEGEAMIILSDTLFFLQLMAQISMLVYAPNDVMWFIPDSPFSGDSRDMFYNVWWVYMFLTFGVLFIVVRMLSHCGVVCDANCTDHIIFTVGDWLCLAFNFALLLITWTDSFRKSFSAYVYYDPSLGNPPSVDWNSSPTIRLHVIDGTGVPMSLKDVEFEVLLVNDSQPFVFDPSDFETTEEATQVVDENTPILHSVRTSQVLRESDFVWTKSERMDLRLNDEGLTTIEGLPHAVRIATVKFPMDDLGILEVRKSDFKLPPTLSIPDNSIMRIRPRSVEDRERLRLHGNLDLRVFGTSYVPGERSANEVFISHVVRVNRTLAHDLKQFFVTRGRSVFICEDIAGGENFRTVIAENSMYCSYFVLLVDVEWVKSGECRFEFNMALRMNLKTGKPVIIPVLMSSDQTFYNAVSFYPEISGMLDQFRAIKYNPDDRESSFHEILTRVVE